MVERSVRDQVQIRDQIHKRSKRRDDKDSKRDNKRKNKRNNRRNSRNNSRKSKSELNGRWRSYAYGLLDLLCPRRCPICDGILRGGEGPVCRSCRDKLPWVRGPRCMRCSRPLEDPRRELCVSCETAERAFMAGWAPFVYERGMRASVLRMKFENRREYLDFYARALAEAGRPFLERVRPACILPVPMHPRKVRRRGYDQCALLARRLGALTGIPVAQGCLIRTRDTLPQKGLSGGDRRKNLAGAFEVLHPEGIPEPVLLLDDIFTTGSTADEIGRTLAASGITRVYVMALTIARDGKSD